MKDDNQKMSTRISCLLEPSTLSKADFLRFYEKQRENGDWTFYEEREFKRTKMYRENDNFGSSCHCELGLKIEKK